MVEFELPVGSSIADLRKALSKQNPAIAPLAPHLMFAVANDYVGDSFSLSEDLQVACIPPVSGG
jgi:molybdopterin converting factor small subunit